ncbi:MAG TPA: glycosyltransferase [Pirellulales bacterium]|nr:glycosyltransferase [Pirellulales bacterium]
MARNRAASLWINPGQCHGSYCQGRFLPSDSTISFMDAVLFVSYYYPGERVFGSDARVAQVLRWFRVSGIDVHFAHLTRKLFERLPLDKLRSQVASFHQVHMAGNRSTSVTSLKWERLTRPRKSRFSRFLSDRRRRSGDVPEQISDLLRRTGSNMLWINHSFISAAAPPPEKNPHVLRLVDTHDVLHLRDATLRAAGLPTEDRLTWETERQMLDSFDVIVAIQDQEREIFQAMFPDRTVIRMGHVVEVAPQPCYGSDIGFVGSAYFMNEVNLMSFLKHAWPEVRSRCPFSKFQIVGGICERAKVRQAADQDRRIVLRGVVPRMEDMYCGPAVMVCPVWTGSGLKIKMVEALSHGKAVVASPIAAQGLEPGAGSAFLVAQEPADFITPVVQLLTDSRQRQQLEAAAINYARQHFQPAQVWQPINEYLASWRNQYRLATSA